ncbi:hypothetical protein OG204_10185 [Streptomyces sp. NBC_01387]|uniref:hypothetical protein n=1 Tax=unclassified Streptomyces TaxID=2593676 RepID=UPI00202453E1|nr:hypothetical protein [Streptomyces sp. A 4/2]
MLLRAFAAGQHVRAHELAVLVSEDVHSVPKLPHVQRGGVGGVERDGPWAEHG